MATRERTTEYAVMRAIGFQSRHIVGMVLGEGFIIALCGALLGLVLVPPSVESLARVLESSGMGGWAGNMALQPKDAALAVAASLALGMIASALPARRAGRLKIVDALRKVE
jgi:putative ABC transport system permease protein